MADSEVRRIGLLAPMVSEFEPLSRHLGLREHQTEPHVVHVGNHGDIDLVATRTDRRAELPSDCSTISTSTTSSSSASPAVSIPASRSVS
jgi:hypothetical protein